MTEKKLKETKKVVGEENTIKNKKGVDSKKVIESKSNLIKEKKVVKEKKVNVDASKKVESKEVKKDDLKETKKEVKDELKKEDKKEIKEETKKEEKKEKMVEPKKEVKKKKFIQKVKKENKKKSGEALESMKKLKSKKSHPVFRGRFGKKNIRRKSIAKWDKWRKPTGIDLDKGLEHGFRPKIGYRNKVELRGIHPSGYKEVLVCNVNDLKKVDVKINAIRFSATMGKKKKNELMKKANEIGAWVLN